MRAENFIAFFTVCGFFVGVMFSALKLSDPMQMIVYTFLITFFFYLLIHVVIMNYVDTRRILRGRLNKDEYEKETDHLIFELGVREKRIENFLSKLAAENLLIKQALGKNSDNNAKAA